MIHITKIINDKYYTPPDLAEYVVEKTKEIIGEDNITEYIEPSAGAGVFLDYLDKPYLAYDIEPEDDRVVKQDFLKLKIEYKKGRCIIGNPPYGSRMYLAQKFFKKSIILSDYISFILPISQYNNTNSLYEFNLIHSEDLGLKEYSDRILHCCFNIYKRPIKELNKRPQSKLKDITIVRQDSKKYDDVNYDVRMCYWGDGTAGKILDNEDDRYSGEYKIIIHNKKLKDQVKHILINYDWKKHIDRIAMRRIKQYHIINVLKEQIPEIE